MRKKPKRKVKVLTPTQIARRKARQEKREAAKKRGKYRVVLMLPEKWKKLIQKQVDKETAVGLECSPKIWLMETISAALGVEWNPD